MTKFYLPCEYGKQLKCTQGNNNNFSHTGKAKYAYDFISTETTHFKICSTADGIVKKLVDSNSKTGLNKGNPGNYILIYHEDNCYSLYYHIDKNSAKVKTGDSVKQGQVIALAGNVGYASGVHLHFQIQKEEKSWGKSISFQFEEASSIEAYKTYTSQNKLSIFSANYKEQAEYPKLIAGGESVEWWIKFTNTGDKIWEDHNRNNQITKLALGTYSDPDIEEGRDFQCGWESPTRLAIVSPSIVEKGEVGTFKFKLKAPSSMNAGKYILQVTPKTPDGWVKQDDGQELNCFAEIDVQDKPLIEDLFDSESDNLKSSCNISNDQSDIYGQSTGMGSLISANADIQNVKWDRNFCLPDEDVKILVECHGNVADGSQLEISIIEKDTQNIVTDPLPGTVYNDKSEISLPVDWINSYSPETYQDSFVVSALIKDGDRQAAISDELQVDSLNFIFL